MVNPINKYLRLKVLFTPHELLTLHKYLLNHLTKSEAKIHMHYFYFSGRLEDKETKGSSEKRTTLTSTLKFRPGIADNLRTVRCEAGHPALPDASLAAELQISVQCKIYFILNRAVGA